jgi:molybdenum cofactor biosynthesis protein B
MVDFQSRDTRRGPVTDDEDEEDDETPADEAESPADEQPSETPADAAADQPDEPPGTEDSGEAAAEDETTADTDPLSEPESADDGESDPLSDADPADDTGNQSAETEPLSDPVPTSNTADETGESDPVSEPLPGDDAEDQPTGTEPDGAPLSDPVAVGGETDDPSDAQSGAAPAPERTVAVALVTVGNAGDGVEDILASGFEAAGHTVTVRERLRGEYDTVQQVVDRLVGRSDVDVVVTAGDVGIGADEVAIEAVHPLLEKALPGFGEAFRTLLYEVIGTGIVAVRTTAGVADGTLVFCLPGDADAAGVAVEEILVPEVPELVEYLDD